MTFWMIVIAVAAFIAGFLTASQVWQYWARLLDDDSRSSEIEIRAGQPVDEKVLGVPLCDRPTSPEVARTMQ